MWTLNETWYQSWMMKSLADKNYIIVPRKVPLKPNNRWIKFCKYIENNH